MKTKSELWEEFDANVKRFSEWKLAPAFMSQYYKDGLWCIQILIRKELKTYSSLYRLFLNPPQKMEYEPYYNSWPGDHRGWMNFKTKEEARDFFKFSTGCMSFEDYCKIERPEYSGARIDLDDAGDFADSEPSQTTEAHND